MVYKDSMFSIPKADRWVRQRKGPSRHSTLKTPITPKIHFQAPTYLVRDSVSVFLIGSRLLLRTVLNQTTLLKFWLMPTALSTTKAFILRDLGNASSRFASRFTFGRQRPFLESSEPSFTSSMSPERFQRFSPCSIVKRKGKFHQSTWSHTHRYHTGCHRWKALD